MVGRLLSFWEDRFSEAMLVSESVFGLENGGFPLPERGYRDPRGAGGAVAVVVVPVAKSTG